MAGAVLLVGHSLKQLVPLQQLADHCWQAGSSGHAAQARELPSIPTDSQYIRGALRIAESEPLKA